MNKEDKELLLMDLCSRIPYKIDCKVKDYDHYIMGVFETVNDDFEWDYMVKVNDVLQPIDIKYIKPYLRPMNSMTNEEFVYFMGIRGQNLTDYEIQRLKKDTFKSLSTITIVNTLQQYRSKLNWLTKNKFDYNGLIEKGLAIDMTKEY